MWIMNVVWQTTALFGGLLAVWVYYGYRLSAHASMKAAMERHGEPANKAETPSPIMVVKERCIAVAAA